MPAASYLVPSRRAALYEAAQPLALSRPAFAKLRSTEERAPGISGAPGAGCVPPGGLCVCLRGRVRRLRSFARPWAALRAPHRAASGGTGPHGTRLPRCARRPPPSLRPALPPDPEPREFCRAGGSVRPSDTAPLTRGDRPSASQRGRAALLPARGSGAAWRRAFPSWRTPACPVRFNTNPRGLGSLFSELVGLT